MTRQRHTLLVTGGGSGLGRAVARCFAREGYQVCVADIDAGRARAVCGEIEAAGGSAWAQAMDVTEEADWNTLYDELMKRWGGLEILVNNAGVAAAGRLEETPLEHWRWILDTDLLSVVMGCHRFLPLLRRQGRGHVVNVASFAGMSPVPEVSAYVTAKAAVVALSEQLRVDLAGSGVGVSVACPAYVQTKLLDSFRSHDERHHQMVKRWMAKSSISADDVAQQVFRAVRKGRFLILTHSETRWLWRFRRWFPNRYTRMMIKIAGKLKARRYP